LKVLQLDCHDTFIPHFFCLSKKTPNAFTSDAKSVAVTQAAPSWATFYESSKCVFHCQAFFDNRHISAWPVLATCNSLLRISTGRLVLNNKVLLLSKAAHRSPKKIGLAGSWDLQQQFAAQSNFYVTASTCNMVLANLKSIYIMHSKEVANRLLPNHFCAKIQTPLLQTDYSHLFCLADVKVESPAA
jgi:hypothetical protein